MGQMTARAGLSPRLAGSITRPPGSASATTGEMQARLGAGEVDHEADDEGGHGRGGNVGDGGVPGVQVGHDADQEAECPGDPAGRVEPGARAGPAAARQQVVGRHRPADRPERGADDPEDAAAGSPATLVTARTMLTIAPMPTEMNGLTLGMTVLKLLAAMNEEKQAPGNAASVRPIMMSGYSAGGSFVARAVGHHMALELFASMTPDGPRAGDGDDRDARRQEDGRDDADVSAHLDVLAVPAVHAEIDARRAGRGEEADDRPDHHQDRRRSRRRTAPRRPRSCS